MIPTLATAAFVLLMLGWSDVRRILALGGSASAVLLLPNSIGGFAGLLGFGILFIGRVAREEGMMLETFGGDYRAYMARTYRVIPGIY